MNRSPTRDSLAKFTPRMNATEDQMRDLAVAAARKGWLCVKVADIRDDMDRAYAVSLAVRHYGVKIEGDSHG
jgi:hypothetical protein